MTKKDELGGKTIAELTALRPKTFSYLIDDNDKKSTKQCATKTALKLEHFKCFLEVTQLEKKVNQLEKIQH